MKAICARIFAQCLLLLLAACGGGSSTTPTSTATTAPEPTLRSIAISPANATFEVGTTLQLVATGTYSDGKTAALTTGLTWSDSSAHSSIFTSGLVTGLSVGTDVLTAAIGTVSGSTGITIKAPYKAVAAGGSHTLVRKADGTLASWGLNRSGQLGDGTSVDRVVPTAVSGASTVWSGIAAGDFHSLSIRTDGSLWAWGFNQNGQLGDKTYVDKAIPTAVGTVKTWASVSAGKAHSIGVMKDGTLWAWGRNFDGQIGDATGADKPAPVQVLMTPPSATSTTTTATAADKIWTAAWAGANFSIGRKTDSTLFSWGGNERGQLGRGDAATVATASNTPTLVAPKPATATAATVAFKALTVSVGSYHVLAIRPDGALFVWGANDQGQLGDGTISDRSAATQVGTETDWAAIAAGGLHSLAIKADGTLWTWGSNSDGQLGVGTTTDAWEPTQIGLSKDWVAISAGKAHSFGLKSDGTLWGWGRNAEGQLGNGAMTIKPVVVPTQLQ